MRRFAALLVLLAAPALAAPVKPAKPKAPAATQPTPEELKLPEGSADYTKMLALVLRYKKGGLTFDQLTQKVVEEKLPPHPLGCGYLMMVPPPPPPGMKYEPASMPKDWVRTFGEVAMTMFAGKLTREEYDQLHTAAHGGRPSFPNCKPLPSP